jgi:hypothetical protein
MKSIKIGGILLIAAIKLDQSVGLYNEYPISREKIVEELDNIDIRFYQ